MLLLGAAANTTEANYIRRSSAMLATEILGELRVLCYYIFSYFIKYKKCNCNISKQK